MSPGLRKSVYIFLTCILGAILFMVLHRLAVFLYLFLLDSSYSTFSFGMSYLELLAVDYVTLLFALMLGGWYGVWLGLYWYQKVYETEDGGGLVNHIAGRVWIRPYGSYDMKSTIASVAERMEADLQELEGLEVSAAAPVLEAKPAKRRVVRRKAPVMKTV